MSEVVAAIGSAQMDKLPRFVRARRNNAKYLMERIAELKGVEFTQVAKDRTHVFYLFTLFVKNRRNEVLRRLNGRGIGAAVYFKLPVHKTPLYQGLGYKGVKVPMAEAASEHVISLPVHPALVQSDLERVADEFVSSVSAGRSRS